MAGRKRVLIVDEDEKERMFLQAILEGEGWETLEAANGQAAVDLAESEQPDLIILDLLLPILNGLEAFKRIRSGPFTNRIPIVILSAINEGKARRHTAADFEKAYRLPPPEAFIDKPVDATFLMNCIWGVVG